MLEIKVDTSGLESAMKEFSRLCAKDLSDVVKQQAGILVGHVIALTPPGGKNGQAITDNGGISLAAKKRGESRIAADIASIFPTTRLPEGQIDALIANRFEWEMPSGRKYATYLKANSLADLALVHRKARNPRSGRTRAMGGHFTAITRPALLKAYIAQEIKKVGKLNAGWINAARELRTASRNVPAWITRHGAASGGSNITGGQYSTIVTIFNNQTWFPGDMSARVKIAVDRRERGLRTAMASIVEKRAKAAEKRMGR